MKLEIMLQLYNELKLSSVEMKNVYNKYKQAQRRKRRKYSATHTMEKINQPNKMPLHQKLLPENVKNVCL